MFEQALVVRGEDEGEAEAAIEVAHEVDELGGVARVEIGGGLVGEDERGAMDDGASDGDALALAAGEEIGAMMGAGGEADVFESFGDAAAAFERWRSLNEKRVLDIFGGGEDGDEIEGLKDEADLFAAEQGGFGRGEAGGVDAFNQDAAGGGLVDAADEVEEGGFAAAAGAGDGEKIAAMDGEREAVEGGDGAVVEREAAGDLLDINDGVR